jgi:hypothetical protein
MALGCAALAWLLAAQEIANHRWLAGIVLGGIVGAIAVWGAYCALSGVRSRVLLFPDRIVVRQLARTRVLNRLEIPGSRVATNGPGFVLVPRGSGHPVQIDWMLKLDEAFFDWLGDLPDLDEGSRQQAEAEIASNARLGATPEERQQTLEKGRRLARPISIVALAVTLWAPFFCDHSHSPSLRIWRWIAGTQALGPKAKREHRFGAFQLVQRA